MRKRKREVTFSLLDELCQHFPMDLAHIIHDYSGIHQHFEVDSWTRRSSWSIDPLKDSGQVLGLIGGDLENWEKGQPEWIADIPSSYVPMVSAWIVSSHEAKDPFVVAEELVLMKNENMIELVPTDEDEGFEDLATVGREMLHKEFTLQMNKGLACSQANILFPPTEQPATQIGEKQAFECFSKRVVLTDSGQVTISGERITSIEEKVYGLDAMWWQETDRLILFLTCMKNVLLLQINIFERQ